MIISEKFLDNYASALMDIAGETKKIDDYLDASNMLVNLLKQNPEYIKLMSNTDLSITERKNILEETFDKHLDPMIMNALYLLIDRDAFYVVRRVFKKVRKLINIKHDVQYGSIFSTVPLTQKQVEVIEKKITAKFGYNIELINKIDLSLIGGIRIIIKHQIIDGSLAGQLLSMKQKVLDNK